MFGDNGSSVETALSGTIHDDGACSVCGGYGRTYAFY